MGSHLKGTEWHTGCHDRASWVCKGRERPWSSNIEGRSPCSWRQTMAMSSKIHSAELRQCAFYWQSQRGCAWWVPANICKLIGTPSTTYSCSTCLAIGFNAHLKTFGLFPDFLSKYVCKNKAQFLQICKFWSLEQLFLSVNWNIYIVIWFGFPCSLIAGSGHQW